MINNMWNYQSSIVFLGQTARAREEEKQEDDLCALLHRRHLCRVLPPPPPLLHRHRPRPLAPCPEYQGGCHHDQDHHHPDHLPPQMYYFILGLCHCVAFSSCVSNPVLYGWLNTNLRKEFLKVIMMMIMITKIIMMMK